MCIWPTKIELMKKKIVCINRAKYKNFKKKKAVLELEKKIPFSVTDFRNAIKINIIKKTKDDLIFNVEGLDLSFMNGIRRSLLSEITTLCIDRVFFYHNSSILNDEVLSHRLGLIPLLVISELLDYFFKVTDDSNKKIIFELDIEHSVNKLKKVSVYSEFLKLKLYGMHFSWLKNFRIQPVFKDILIAKLNPGQKIKCECHCKIGKGETHAKFSPVGTAFYRIFPRIKLVNEVFNESASNFVKKCPVSVFEIEENYIGWYRRLFVSNPEYCTLCRECTRIENGEKKNIRLGRIREKTTFIIESTGVSSPENLFHRAICLLTGKCNKSMSILLKNFGNTQFLS
jgi:DNA-directed RNA polymerase I and III subunit RPAC1